MSNIKIHVRDVMRATAKIMGVPLRQIDGREPARKRWPSLSRLVAMVLAYELTDHPRHYITARFKRDKTCFSYAQERVAKALENGEITERTLDDIRIEAGQMMLRRIAMWRRVAEQLGAQA